MTPTTDLQKLLAEATKGPWKQGATLTTAQTRRWTAAQMQANDAVERQRVFANFDFGDEGRSRVFIAETRAEANARLIAMAPDLAARVIELEAENKRLRERLNTIRALAAKSQNEGGPNCDLEIIEGFAIAALEGGVS